MNIVIGDNLASIQKTESPECSSPESMTCTNKPQIKGSFGLQSKRIKQNDAVKVRADSRVRKDGRN